MYAQVINQPFRKYYQYTVYKYSIFYYDIANKYRTILHNIFDAIPHLSAQFWRGLTQLAQMHKKHPFLRAGVEGRQSRAEGSGGGRAPTVDSPLVGHGDVHSYDGCRDRMRQACASLRGAQRVTS